MRGSAAPSAFPRAKLFSKLTRIRSLAICTIYCVSGGGRAGGDGEGGAQPARSWHGARRGAALRRLYRSSIRRRLSHCRRCRRSPQPRRPEVPAGGCPAPSSSSSTLVFVLLLLQTEVRSHRGVGEGK